MKRACKKAFAAICSLTLAVSCFCAMNGVVYAKGAKMQQSVNVGTNVFGAELPENYYDRKVVGYFPN